MSDQYFGFEQFDPASFQAADPGLLPVLGMQWAVMDDFKEHAKNHCGATLLTNYTLLMEEKDQAEAVRSNITHTSSITSLARRSIFKMVHRYVPNGPIFRMKTRANRYFEQERLDSRCDRIPLRQVCSELDQGNACAFLTAQALFNWHWVLVVGYETSQDGSHTYLIVDEWHRKGLSRYVPGRGSKVLASYVFRRGQNSEEASNVL